VTFLSKVGRDDFGRFCLQELQHEGISTQHVQIAPTAKTGVTISLSTRSDRALVTVLGAISQLRYSDLDINALRGHRHLHMTSYFLQTRLRDSFARILQEAKRLGLTTSFDPNSDPLSSWSGDIREVIEEGTILFLNHEEAIRLTRKKQVRAALDHLAKRVHCVVIKLGAKGAIAAMDGQTVAVPAFKITPADTTGAGDSFAAGFVDAYLRQQDLRECLIEANACGAFCAMRVGGTTGQPSLAQLSRFLKRRRIELTRPWPPTPWARRSGAQP
jgi:sugar/nucleoside kinase (ribokinase family)